MKHLDIVYTTDILAIKKEMVAEQCVCGGTTGGMRSGLTSATHRDEWDTTDL